MALNVLLMLSSNQAPPPEDEVRWHANQCAQHHFTHLITTRTLKGLTEGNSVVAFYGSMALNNLYLGRGVYLGYIPLRSPQGQEILRSSYLYSNEEIPENSKGFIKLRDLCIAQPGETLESLQGIIRTTGRPLALQNIPRGQARGQVYYRNFGAGTVDSLD